MLVNALENIEWDSQFFGYPVARILLDKEGGEILNYLFEKIAAQKIRLTYFFVPPAEIELNKYIIKRGGILVDQKAEYSKMAELHQDFSNSITEYVEQEINDKLIGLVLQAGLFSRFHIDGNFTNNEYERLYIEWLTRSVTKKIAFKTFVASNETEIVGITTLGEKASSADIGLVAVDKNSRGNKIGYDLINTADKIAFEMGFKEIKVTTQLQNTGACRLYEKCNFHIVQITNIYHFWQK